MIEDRSSDTSHSVLDLFIVEREPLASYAGKLGLQPYGGIDRIAGVLRQGQPCYQVVLGMLWKEGEKRLAGCRGMQIATVSYGARYPGRLSRSDGQHPHVAEDAYMCCFACFADYLLQKGTGSPWQIES
jgi:hypothetical protein